MHVLYFILRKSQRLLTLVEPEKGIEPLAYALRAESRSRIESLELLVSISLVASTSCESDYDDDKTDWQSEKHKPGNSAKGCAFV